MSICCIAVGWCFSQHRVLHVVHRDMIACVVCCLLVDVSKSVSVWCCVVICCSKGHLCSKMCSVFSSSPQMHGTGGDRWLPVGRAPFSSFQ